MGNVDYLEYTWINIEKAACGKWRNEKDRAVMLEILWDRWTWLLAESEVGTDGEV